MKKIVASFLVLVLSISLAACGKTEKAADSQPIESVQNTAEESREEFVQNTVEEGKDEPAETSIEDTKEEKEEIKAEEPAKESLQDKLLKEDTYWTAYELRDAFGAEKLPADYKWIDLILRADGSAQFREVHNEMILNNDLMLHMTWKLKGDRLGLYIEGFDDPYCEGTLDENGIALGYYSGTLYMKQSEMPGKAGELLSPAQLTGTWVLASGMAEGWEWDAREEREYGVLFFDSVWNEEIVDLTLAADYESRAGWGDMRDSFYDRELTLLKEPIYEGCGNETWSVRIGQESPLNENGYPQEKDYYVTLVDENILLLQTYYSIDGGPGVSYSYYKRILPTISVWELETADLEGGDWDFISYTDAEGNELEEVPGMENLYVHLDVMGNCSVSWEEPSTGEFISGEAKWILGNGGGLLIYEGDREEIWFSGGILMHNIETRQESIYNLEMYLYYAGGVIKLVHEEGSGGENYGGEGMTEDFGESYLYLEQMANDAVDGALLVMYGDEFLNMGEYAELPHYNRSENGSDSHNILITAIYDDTEIYVGNKDGEEESIDYLDAYGSMVLRIDIPDIPKQYIGILVNGEYFTYDISRASVDLKDWTYLTR